ncbi:MAG: hypothetical protein IRZ02_09700 [Acidothermus sp.]|nr:hypothetical protein [Acidothermus sp.]
MVDDQTSRQTDGTPSADLVDLPAALDRVAQKLSRMTPRELSRRIPGRDGLPQRRVDVARALAERLAVVVQGVEHAHLADPPAWRRLPYERDGVVGFQLRVLAHDLAGFLPHAPAQIWTPAGRRPLADVLAELAADLERLEMFLPG